MAIVHARMSAGRRVQQIYPTWPKNARLPTALRRSFVNDRRSRELATPTTPLAQLEAIFLLADEPITARRLAGLLGMERPTLAVRLIEELQRFYERTGSSFQVEEIAGGYQLFTRSEYHPWILRFRQTAGTVRLSRASQETLAIIAYRQPIMRAEVEGIRGVQCGEVLRMLMEKGLIRMVRRDESLGRPVLYGTTRKFLQVFGLKDLDELPMAESLKPPSKVSDQSQTPEVDQP